VQAEAEPLPVSLLQVLHHAQNLQKIFPVAEGDNAQGPSCSVEREYCPHSLKGPRLSSLVVGAGARCGIMIYPRRLLLSLRSNILLR